MNILILSCGTRDKVVQYFKEVFAGEGRVVTTDCNPYAPALYESDAHYIVPRMTAPGYIDVIFDICKKAQKAFGDNIRKPLAEYCKTHKKEIPAHLTSVPDQKRTLPYEPKAMMFVYAAINRGLHPHDLGPCPETIAVFD